jgi:hypothetical protein
LFGGRIRCRPFSSAVVRRESVCSGRFERPFVFQDLRRFREPQSSLADFDAVEPVRRPSLVNSATGVRFDP